MKKSKDGSTLIVTVVIFMFVTVVSVAFLSMISSNYYSRVSENKRTQNLYGSESGLDATYNVIAKTIEAASVYGNTKVETLKKAKDLKLSDLNDKDDDQKALYALYADIDYWKYYNGNLKEKQTPLSQSAIDGKIKIDNDYIDILINKVFKDGFKNFIHDNLNTSIMNTQYIQFINNGTLEKTTEKLENGDNLSNTKIYMGKNSTNTNADQAVNANSGTVKLLGSQAATGDTNISINNSEIESMLTPNPKGNSVDVNKIAKVESGYDEDGRIQYTDYEVNFSLYNEEDYALTVTSEFQTDSNNVKVGDNLRVIEANYSLRVPNYNEIAFKESTADTDINKPKDIPGIAIGGDMLISGSELNVSGDIFVQGNDPTINNSNRTFEKYSGGIILDNNLAQKTVKFNDNVFTRGTFNIKNNVNATIGGDLYARNIYAGDGNNLSDNSKLTVNQETVVDNDLTVKATNTQIGLKDFYGINDKAINEDSKVRKSSSIIINDYKDISKPNKLPSSVTITNKAYIMGVAHINTQDGYETGESVAVRGNYKAYSVLDPQNSQEKFKYDSPLEVLDESIVDNKAKHFVNYWNNSGDSSIDFGGVTLPSDTYSIGAILNKNGDKVSSLSAYNSNIEDIIIPQKRLDYARKVYTLGQTVIDDKEAGDRYKSMGSNADNVSGLLGKIYDYNLNSKPNDGRAFAMFCSDASKNIVIKGKKSTSYYPDDIVINAEDNKDVEAVVVTKGKVIIDGDVNFRGNIIANKNLEVLGNGEVNIYYDKNKTEDIQKSNSKVFNDVFGDNSGGENLNNQALNIQSNSTNFLKAKLWKIIQ